MRFVSSPNSKAFILKGYAGTGKTTLMKYVIDQFEKEKIRYSLLASTGRAAKILANATQREATTVHSQIYSFSDLNQDLELLTSERENTEVDKSGQLLLNFTLLSPDTDSTTIYIVDE